MLGALGPALGKLAGCNCGTIQFLTTVTVNSNFFLPGTCTITIIIQYLLPLFRVMARVLTGGCYGPSLVPVLPQPLAGAQHPRRYGPDYQRS